MKYLSEYIVKYYIKKNIIDPKMKPIYMHGVSLIINDIINFSAILFIAAIIDSFSNGIIFIATFYLLRIRCGGFHATKEWICRVTMMLTFLSVFTICHLLQRYNTEWIVPIIVIVSSLILMPIIPIENPNKELTDEVRKKNRKYAFITILLFAFVSVILIILNRHEGTIISVTILSVAVLAVMGKKVNNKRKRGDKIE